MAVIQVTKGPLLLGDDATLESIMDFRDHASTHDNAAANDRSATDPLPLDDLIDAQRLQKITRLKQAIDAGTYHVSADDLADKLIAHMLEPKG